MTEAEWLAGGDSQPMLVFLREKLSDRKSSDRKFRLFAVACWVHSVHFHGTPRERHTLLGLQHFAEGERSRDEVLALAGKPEWAALAASGWEAAHLWAGQAFRPAHLLREIFGNPFRPATVDPGWRTTNVVSVAQSIYEESDFDRLPILADALEDAGCTNAEVLAHGRDEGPHVRGCWVVDLLLGKS